MRDLPLIVAHPAAVCKGGVDGGDRMCYHFSMDEKLHLKLTIRLCGEDGQRCFGPGVAALLHQVEAHCSLRAAAAAMGMAYSKAWRIVRTAEEAFGCKLLHSTTGGRNGGGAALTERGAALLAAYDTYCGEVEAFSRERFSAAFAPFQQEE